jgi:hypothetical protein
VVLRRRLNGWALWVSALACLASLLVMPHAAFAAGKEPAPVFDPPMRFVVVRSNAPGCEPTCPEWISAEGKIEPGTPALFKRALKAVGGRKLPVVVDSPGGSVEAALALGRMIRRNKLDIAVGKTRFTGCQPDVKGCRENNGKGAGYFGSTYANGATCNSACPLMFSGGIRRVVGEWAYLGVHQITTTFIRTKLLYRTTYRMVKGKKRILSTKIVSRKNAGSYKTYEMSKGEAKKLAAYLKEMGVGLGVLETMKNTPASEIHQLVPYNMLRMNLVTSLDSVDLLTAGTICSANPQPGNCREIPASGQKAAKPADAVMAEAKPAPVTPVEPETVRRDDVGNMRFVQVRGSDPLCNPDCPEWISAQGIITPDTPKKLHQLLDSIGDRRLPLIVSSPGGDVLSAMVIGRLIRDRQLDVAVARTNFDGCKPEEAGCTTMDDVYSGVAKDHGGQCDAACLIVLAGGARRFAGPDTIISVQPLAFAERIRVYLAEMSVKQDLFPPVQFDFADFRLHRFQLGPISMFEMGLTTGPQSADHLVGPAVCEVDPRPQNCQSELKVQAQVPVEP